ncbi:MAG: hypothetical protein AB1510_05485 [Bacillota bacterium]
MTARVGDQELSYHHKPTHPIPQNMRKIVVIPIHHNKLQENGIRNHAP